MRKTTYENRKARFEAKRMVYSIEQVEDVLDLIANGKRPNGDFGDDECVLWETIIRTLGISIK